jgi:hypothetical protein
VTSYEVVFHEARQRAAACLIEYLDCRCEHHARELEEAAEALRVAALRVGYPALQERAEAFEARMERVA